MRLKMYNQPASRYTAVSCQVIPRHGTVKLNASEPLLPHLRVIPADAGIQCLLLNIRINNLLGI
jgi:hypothetical protein